MHTYTLSFFRRRKKRRKKGLKGRRKKVNEDEEEKSREEGKKERYIAITLKKKKWSRDWNERSLDHFKVWKYIGRPQNLSPKLGKALTIKKVKAREIKKVKQEESPKENGISLNQMKIIEEEEVLSKYSSQIIKKKATRKNETGNK